MKTNLQDFGKEIKILEVTYEKIMTYAKHAKGEISGLGFINDEGIVYDARIFKQTNSSVTTDLNIQDVINFMDDLAQNDPDKIKDTRVWWHSHDTGACCWSTTDTDNIKELLNDMDELISIVVNKQKSHKCRMDVNVEIAGKTTILEIEDMILKPIAEVDEEKEEQIQNILLDATLKCLDIFDNITTIDIAVKEKIEIGVKQKKDKILTEEQIAEIKADINKDSEDKIQELYQKNDMVGWSPMLYKSVLFDQKIKKYYFQIGNIKRYLTDEQVVIRMKEVQGKEETVTSKKLEDFYDKKVIKKLVNKDEDNIKATGANKTVLGLYYSEFKELFEDIDSSITIQAVKMILAKIKDPKKSILYKLTDLTQAKAAACNEILEIMCVDFEFALADLSMFICMIPLINIEWDIETDCFVYEIKD